MVEFALILPVLLFLVLGMVEMGFAISNNTSIVTATRQGARVGAELVNGSPTYSCSDSSGAALVDDQIMLAVEGVLTSPGSLVTVAKVNSIDIFEVNGTTGAPVVDSNNHAYENEWVPGTTTFTINSTQQIVDFALGTQPSGTAAWLASSRCGSAPAPGIGVRINYTYSFVTPLGSLIPAFGASLKMTDQTIMALEPPKS